MDMGRTAGLLLVLASQSCLAEKMEIETGLWEFAIRYEFIGVPQHFPEYVKKQCISAAAPVPAISRPGQECKDTLQGRFGQNTLTWELDCSTDWEMVHGMGRIHYDGAKASGDVHLQVLNPYNPPQPMVFRIKGKRLGNCGN
jgi:hypothetical protein